MSYAAIESESIDERSKLVRDFAKSYDESVKRQVGIIEAFTDRKIDLDELQKESDISVLTQKVRALGLSEIIEGRLLEILRDRIDAQRDINDVEREMMEERVKASLSAYEMASAGQISSIMQAGEQEFKALSEQLANKEITLKQYNKRMLELSKELTREQDEIMLESLLEQARLVEAAGGDVIGIEKEIFALKKKMREEDSADVANKADLD